MKYVVIKDNTVTNIILWDKTNNPEYIPDGLAIPVDESQIFSIGWSYMDGKFVNPNPTQLTEEI